MFSRKVIGFISSVAVAAAVAGVSVAFATITFNNTSMTGDTSFNSIVGVVSTTLDLTGSTTTLSIQTTSGGATAFGGSGYFLGNLAEGTSTVTNLLFVATSTPILVVSSTGKIGVGTSSPSQLFVVATSSNAFAVDIFGNASTTNNASVGGYLLVTGQTTLANVSGTSIGLSGASYVLGNLGMATTTTSNLLFIATSTPILVVSSTGKIGVGTSSPSQLFVVATSSNAFAVDIFGNASTTNNASVGGYLLVTGNLRNAAHVNSTGTIPGTPTSCGTSPSVVGTDNAFRVTVGTGASTPICTVPFATAFANKPVCTVTNINTSTQMIFQASSTASNITIAAFSSSSTAPIILTMSQVQLAVICVGID